MNSKQDVQGRWALVTGASSGLGADFARELAGRGCHVILVARRQERLEQLAAELQQREHGVQALVMALDLARREAPDELFARTRQLDEPVDILINNAGFAVYGKFLKSDWEKERQMLDLDITALTHLTKLFAKDMVERRWGRILQVASVGAYQAMPTYAAYGAAKSFVLHFGEALNEELRGTGVSCTVLSPGVTATEFFDVAGQQPTLYHRLLMMESPEVARIGIEALLARRSSVVAGRFNALNAWLVRLLPRRLAARLALQMNLRDPLTDKLAKRMAAR